jgi:hypothetical protein
LKNYLAIATLVSNAILRIMKRFAHPAIPKAAELKIAVPAIQTNILLLILPPATQATQVIPAA